MGDNLPLIPEKRSLCADVHPVIRAVFRELDYLSPLTSELPAPVVDDHLASIPARDQPDQWIEKYRSECKEIWTQEGELKHQHARRISREPLPNIYKLCSPRAQPVPTWRLNRGLIARRDLVPTIEQNAGREGSLWIKNILNRSSCELSSVEVVGRSLRQPARLVPADDGVSLQSLSIGAVETRPPLPPPAPPPPLLQPDYILCVPTQLDFINFTVGHLHTHRLRLVNVSKFEIRLSVRPPKRRELDVELCGPRGLTVTSGAAAELRVHFRPSDVRAVRDTLLVRASMGRDFEVPIACYMQPPVLDILIPSVTTSVLSCTPDALSACTPLPGCDVLELGARLLGDVHCVRVLLRCDADHASFFMLTEDAWLSFSLDCLTARGSVLAGPFALWPAWWGGGGCVRGRAWCRAERAGLHAAPLRLLSSTAVARPLHVLADALMFRPDHLTIVAQEKDYDICGDGEPACEYYVQLGTAFPHRPLSATVQLVNHSPVVYSYYWRVRPWGVCSCGDGEKGLDGSVGTEDHNGLCVGAKEARSIAQDSPETFESRSENARLLRVEPARGQIVPRSACALHVHVPDAGARLGVQRAVLMLILKDIPKKSFPPDFEHMIVSVEEVATEPIPGVESVSREVCELVCAQMEVWWEVAPVRFVLDPPKLVLYHSRRRESVMVDITATQLFGSEGARVTWQAPGTPPAPLRLTPAHACQVTLRYPLPSLSDHFPRTDVITMVAANDEWRSQCTITRQCATRHPALQPALMWLGVVAPGTHMHTKFQLVNDTHQQICWLAEPFRWCGESVPSPASLGRTLCEHCQERACSCGLLSPARGKLRHKEVAEIYYDVNAPECDGCVATLVRVRRSGADGARAGGAGGSEARAGGAGGSEARAGGAGGSEARAALVAYRVLAPRVVLRVLPCASDSGECGSGCSLDAGSRGSARGTATLRPRRALALGRRACYRLRVANVTPLPAAVHFDRDNDAMDVLKAKFSPNDFRVRPYGEVDVQVVLEARKVCGRRLFVYRGQVERAHKPVYLVVDTAIDGLKITCEVPLGGGLEPDSFVIMSRTQREEFPWEVRRPQPATAEEVFAAEDRERQAVREKKCRCPFEMAYIPPTNRPEPPANRPEPPAVTEEETPVEIVWPPAQRRACACDAPAAPAPLPPVCLQFTAVPLRTVRTRTLRLRNESVVTARWSVAVRRWPRRRHRTLAAEQWAGEVRAPGVALQCAPAAGVLAARAAVRLRLRVYADCWGLYRDQLLIQIEHVEPIVLDVWVEAVGAPLQLAIAPAGQLDVTPTVWLSAADRVRVLRARNTSRARLRVHAYTARRREYPQDVLPFRLYLRLYDVTPRACACATFHSDLIGEESDSCSITEEADTGFEIYLAPDYGPQTDDHYTVSPEVCTVPAGECAAWRVALAPRDTELPPDVNLLLRLQPDDCLGPGWWRAEPAPQVARLRVAPRRARLELSCRELRVTLCALDLPYGDVLRVRKRFHVINVGNGVLELGVRTEAPWCVVQEHEDAAPGPVPPLLGALCGAGCACAERVVTRHEDMSLRLEPRSSTEMCVEVSLSAAEVWPTAPEYPPRTVAATALHFFDDDNVLKSVPLVLELEFPALRVRPPSVDLGCVADGDTRKTYFSVSHTSRTVTLDVATHWEGSSEFQIWPPNLRIPPGGSANVYLQYTATWRGAPAEGCAHVRAARRAAGAWCRAGAAVRAAPARGRSCHAPPHDHTDEPRPLPPAGAHH